MKNITPDSLSGIIFALEGISRSVVLLNGPTGCKFYHSSITDSQMIKQREFDPLNFTAPWFFGQPRVPCTYLDTNDYVYGSEQKLIEAIAHIRDNVEFDLLCIVNSPGAALIGDDLRGIAQANLKDKPCFIFETPGFSEEICAGFETAVLELLRQGEFQRRNPAKWVVNILGLSVFHRNYIGDKAEIGRLLEMCGIEVNCFLGADCDWESVKNIPGAALNIVLHPEYGVKTAEWMKENLGMPYYICDGPPIGFAATDKFISDVCSMLGADPSPYMEESERARGSAYVHISRVNSLTGLPKGVLYAVEGTFSEVYSYAKFMTMYFGMILECTDIICEQNVVYAEKLRKLLEDLNMSTAFGMEIMDSRAELVFASGNTIARLKTRDYVFCGVETALPTFGYLDVIPKATLGLAGALLLTEQVLNGLMFK